MTSTYLPFRSQSLHRLASTNWVLRTKVTPGPIIWPWYNHTRSDSIIRRSSLCSLCDATGYLRARGGEEKTYLPERANLHKHTQAQCPAIENWEEPQSAAQDNGEIGGSRAPVTRCQRRHLVHQIDVWRNKNEDFQQEMVRKIGSYRSEKLYLNK